MIVLRYRIQIHKFILSLRIVDGDKNFLCDTESISERGLYVNMKALARYGVEPFQENFTVTAGRVWRDAGADMWYYVNRKSFFCAYNSRSVLLIYVLINL